MRTDYFRIAYGVSRFESRLMQRNKTAFADPLISLVGRRNSILPPDRASARTQLGFVDFIAFARSSRFGEVVSGGPRVPPVRIPLPPPAAQGRILSERIRRQTSPV